MTPGQILRRGPPVGVRKMTLRGHGSNVGGIANDLAPPPMRRGGLPAARSASV